ncbi:MAG: DUF5714 domain-containing protein [Methanoregula sp.]|jgi:hypothetical protein|uniref:DUF5714 domain-containing protein n=1 Tax=Methanoregula sp. TaxID=2052170 RepID=UPI003D0F3BF3
MTDYRTGCMVCGKPLHYLESPEQHECAYCHKVQMANAVCVDGHFVCDRCHQLGADDAIEQYCTKTTETDPIRMAITLMQNPVVNMHGPEHHFLVPAVLLAAYCNITGQPDRKAKLIATARERAGMIKGGACGFMGDCGAAVGTGIFISLVTGATPLSHREWQQANLVVAKSLMTIAMHGGPRCCKRNTFLAIQGAVAFAAENLDVKIPIDPKVTCQFYGMNAECRTTDCPFYPVR